MIKTEKELFDDHNASIDDVGKVIKKQGRVPFPAPQSWLVVTPFEECFWGKPVISQESFVTLAVLASVQYDRDCDPGLARARQWASQVQDWFKNGSVDFLQQKESTLQKMDCKPHQTFQVEVLSLCYALNSMATEQRRSETLIDLFDALKPLFLDQIPKGARMGGQRGTNPDPVLKLLPTEEAPTKEQLTEEQLKELEEQLKELEAQRTKEQLEELEKKLKDLVHVIKQRLESEPSQCNSLSPKKTLDWLAQLKFEPQDNWTRKYFADVAKVWWDVHFIRGSSAAFRNRKNIPLLVWGALSRLVSSPGMGCAIEGNSATFHSLRELQRTKTETETEKACVPLIGRTSRSPNAKSWTKEQSTALDDLWKTASATLKEWLAAAYFFRVFHETIGITATDKHTQKMLDNIFNPLVRILDSVEPKSALVAIIGQIKETPPFFKEGRHVSFVHLPDCFQTSCNEPLPDPSILRVELVAADVPVDWFDKTHQLAITCAQLFLAPDKANEGGVSPETFQFLMPKVRPMGNENRRNIKSYFKEMGTGRLQRRVKNAIEQWQECQAAQTTATSPTPIQDQESPT